jgi:hypothetical protein
MVLSLIVPQFPAIGSGGVPPKESIEEISEKWTLVDI